MKQSAAQLASAVDARKRPYRAAPWMLEVRGPQYWLCVDEVTAAALAAGHVTARLQCQAALLTRHLNETEEAG